MKKILSLLLALALVLGTVGCQAANYIPDEIITSIAETTEVTETVTIPVETDTSETTEAPTEKPEPKPTEPKPTEPKPTEPEPTESQATEPESTEPSQSSSEPTIPEQPPLEPPETQPVIEPETESATQPTPKPEIEPTTQPTEPEPTTKPSTQKRYTGKEEVAQYIDQYGRLPDNFITKSQAKALGWKSGRRLDDYAPGKCIGGDRFYNKEGLLPSGHTYYECDIDTLGKTARGAKRIVFSKDGLIYYTSDHYESFYQYLGPNQWKKI